MSRLTLALAALLIAQAAPGSAMAHALLKAAIPAPGSTISAAPAEVAITFSEGVEPGFSKIVVQDAKGQSVTDGPLHHAGSADNQLAAPLKKLGAGAYTVIWHAVSVDTHKTHGTFTFTVTQ